MKKENLEEALKKTLHKNPPMANDAHRKQTLLLVRNESDRRNQRERISFRHFLWRQIRFIGWKIWAAQGAGLLLLSSILIRVYGTYFLRYPKSVTKILFCLSVLVSMMALPLIYRSVRYQMQEVEAATYYSSVKLLMAKLAVIGIGDIFILAGLFITILVKTSLQAGSAFFYLCIPFLFVSSASLFMLGHLTPKRFMAGSMGLCAVLMVLCITVSRHLKLLFPETFSVGWVVVCVLLVAFGIAQIRYLLYRSSYAEMQIA